MEPQAKKNLTWFIIFCGNAIGSGILFLPVQTGVAGVWMLVLSAIIGYPLLYLTQRLFINVLVGAEENGRYTDIIEEYKGPTFSFVASILYFVAMFFAIMSYTIALNNDIGGYLHEYGVFSTDIARNPLLGLVIIFVLIFIVWIGENVLVRVMGPLVGVLIVMLFVVSILLIPNWKMSNFNYFPGWHEFPRYFILTLPLIMSSILFWNSISSGVQSYRDAFPDREVARLNVIKTMFVACIFLSVFVFFFAFSCTMSMTRAEAQEAMTQNISVMAVISRYIHSGFIKVLGSCISVFALTCTSLAVLIGVREAVNGFAMNFLFKNKSVNPKVLDAVLLVIVGLVLWGITILNFSALELITSYKAPTEACIIALIPAFLVFTVPKLRKYRGVTSCLVILFGLLILAAFFVGVIE